ncbi:hypothetical protein FS842_005409 [Serendipita sp. 407]|nr:hypothetical protein FS842_005409 [Serendipita sp. 407]
MALEPRLVELAAKLGPSTTPDEDPVLNIVTAALDDQQAKWNLEDINAVVLSSEDIQLNALDLCPCLWQHVLENEGATRLLNTISIKASSKECIITLQEIQETLSTNLSLWAQDDQEDEEAGHRLVEKLSFLLQLYSNIIPRMVLRKKGPLETLGQLIKGISTALRLGSAAANKGHGRKLLESLSEFIVGANRWVKASSSASDNEKNDCIDLLATLLLNSLATCGSYIQANIAELYLENHFPRRYLHSSVDSESLQGQEVASLMIESAKELKLRPKSLLKLASQGGGIALACIVLIAHWPIEEDTPELQQLSQLGPQIEFLLQSSSLVDECMFLLMSRANTQGELEVDTLASAVAALASSSPNPVQRNTAFVTLSLLVKKIPPPARLAFFSELLSNENPFPQMRVAAVGLVKESVLEALASPEKNILASNALFGQLGRFLLRPDPLDLFGGRFDPKEFLTSSEPPRLIECLGFYYTLLQRDTSNKTGIRDPSSVSDTRRGLLDPLAGCLDNLQSVADENSGMSVIALQIALERAQDALVNQR